MINSRRTMVFYQVNVSECKCNQGIGI